MDLGKIGVLSSVSSVGSSISSFEEENSPSDLPKSVFGGGDPSSTVTSVGSAHAVWVGGSVSEF